MRLENYKDRAKKAGMALFQFLKPFAGAALIIGFLQLTGLLSSVTYASNWALLQTGVKNASDEVEETGELFNYDFLIKDMNGQRIPMSQFKNKVIFLNLWATWCGPCRAEMAGIDELYKQVDKSNIEFIMLSIDRDADHDKIVAYMQKKGFSFAAYQPSGALPQLLDVPSIPTTFIIGKDGKVLQKEVGSMKYNTKKFRDFLTRISQ
jgi:thiol-disulfide isomerase/thioredoxin